MGYYTSFRGELAIEPPAPWTKVKDSKFLGPNADACVWIECSEEVEHTDDGETIRRRADRIVFCDEGHNHYDMVDHVQEIVDAIGPGHQFVGRIDAEGEANEDMWRLKVIFGKAVEFKPQLVWPEESE